MNSMTLSETRIKFKLRRQMFDVKWNYKSDLKCAHVLWKCDSCQTSIETQTPPSQVKKKCLTDPPPLYTDR